MNTQRTIKGVSFFSRATSLEDAQRMNANKSEKEHLPKDEFIMPMWISPEDRKEI